MNQLPLSPNEPGISLVRSDLIHYEVLLKQNLEQFFSCSRFSLTFPPEPPKAMRPNREPAEYKAILETDRLLLPLVWKDTLLGIALIRDIEEAALRPLLPILPQIAGLALKNISLHKESITDIQTGLRNRTFLMQALQREIGLVSDSMTPGPNVCVDAPLGGHSAGFGFLLVDMDRFTWVNRSFGHLFGDRVMADIGATLRTICTDQAFLARMGADSFAVLWPQASLPRCMKFAERIRTEPSEKEYDPRLSRDRISVTASIGLCSYPRDFHGGTLQKSISEQARIVLEKAEKGLARAKASGRNRVCAFHSILEHGGTIQEVLSLNRVRVDLGRNTDACERQRFQVRPPALADTASPQTVAAELKGEISLTEVTEDSAIGEVLVHGDPARPMQPGDRLFLVREEPPFTEGRDGTKSDQGREKDPTDLLGFRDFLRTWQHDHAGRDRFCMALVRFSPEEVDGAEPLPCVFKAVRSHFGPRTLCGQYSRNCIICSIPDTPEEDLRRAASAMADFLAGEYGMTATVGMAQYPFLDTAKSDIPENTRKALDHASLLPPPGIAVCDPLSLTVRGDRLFAEGDMYAAMEEYKQALAADEDNTLARNSLAVCYARLHRTTPARHHFRQILLREPENLMTWYNYGTTCLKDRDLAEARKAFTRCLELDPNHAFALFRMGAMAEQEGDLEEALACYRKVEQTDAGRQFIPRHLGRLALRRGELDEAGEHLHRAIVANPGDHIALHLLAGIYLDRGEDPEIAETLARQSVSLSSDLSSSWKQLARALDAQGKGRQAEEARNRARDCSPLTAPDPASDPIDFQRNEKK